MGMWLRGCGWKINLHRKERKWNRIMQALILQRVREKKYGM